MSGADSPRRKNAREDFRRLTDAEAYAQELERTMRSLQTLVAKLIPEHEAESDARPARETGTTSDILAMTLASLGRVKGRMYLERVARGLFAGDIALGSGWSEHTLRQFENRESDAMVSSLFRYAAGLRAAGVPGRIEIRWVADPADEEKGLKAA